MTDIDTPETDPATADYVASAARAVLGAVPFAGSLLAELAGSVIPNQRIDRLCRFAHELEQRLQGLDRQAVRAQLSNENFTDLTEEALRQAARSTTDDRRRYIANLLATGLSTSTVSFIEAKHLLRILGEINDIEIVWLRFYLNPVMDGDTEFRKKHEAVLQPVAASFGSEQTEIDRETLQDSYRAHLVQLGLLEERYRIDSRTKLPEFDRSGRPTVQGHEITRLGRLLLSQLGLGEDPAV